MKLPLLLLAALLGSKVRVGSCGSIQALGERDQESPPSPLEEVETAEGATVSFFEAGQGTGVLAAASSAPKGIIDPIDEYLDKAGVGGSKARLADLYVHLTGKEPSGLLFEALRRQEANEDGESERKDWRAPETEEGATPDDPSAAEGGKKRKLCLDCDSPVGSKQWWIDVACRSVTPYDWCSCLPYRTGSGYKVKKSDDFYQKVYVYRGGMQHKLEYWSCATGKCRWTYLVSSYVLEGYMSTMWGEGGGSWSYKGSTSYADGDGYHLSWFDAEDSDTGCVIAGLGGCNVCPNIA